MSHGVFDPRDGLLVRRSDLRALLIAFEYLATAPERCQGEADLLHRLAQYGVLDTYHAIKIASAAARD